jgi:hypothetical protein
MPKWYGLQGLIIISVISTAFVASATRVETLVQHMLMMRERLQKSCSLATQTATTFATTVPTIVASCPSNTDG